MGHAAREVPDGREGGAFPIEFAVLFLVVEFAAPFFSRRDGLPLLPVGFRAFLAGLDFQFRLRLLVRALARADGEGDGWVHQRTFVLTLFTAGTRAVHIGLDTKSRVAAVKTSAQTGNPVQKSEMELCLSGFMPARPAIVHRQYR
jgi:hypothetical protein